MGGIARPVSTRLLIAATVFTVACTGAMLASRALGIPSIIPKMLASTGFLVAAWGAGAFASPYGRAVFVGLCFSWFGDLFLAIDMFLAGLVAFLLGHVAYAIAFALHGLRPAAVAVAAVLLLAPVYLLFQWLNPHVGDDMRYPVYAYMLVITVMLIFSVGAWRKNGTVLMFIAALMFWLSDIFVARQQFVVKSSMNPAFGLPLYFGGQLVFAWSIQRLRAFAP